MFNWCFDAFIWRLFPMTLSGQGQLVNENGPCPNAKWQASRNFPWHYLIPTGDLKVQSARVGINRFDRYQINKSWQDVFWCFMEPTVYTLSSYPWRHGTAAKLPRCLATMAGLLATIELCLGPCDAWIKERNLEEVNTSKLVAMNIATASLFFFFRGEILGEGKGLKHWGSWVEWSGWVRFGKCQVHDQANKRPFTSKMVRDSPFSFVKGGNFTSVHLRLLLGSWGNRCRYGVPLPTTLGLRHTRWVWKNGLIYGSDGLIQGHAPVIII